MEELEITRDYIQAHESKYQWQRKREGFSMKQTKDMGSCIVRSKGSNIKQYTLDVYSYNNKYKFSKMVGCSSIWLDFSSLAARNLAFILLLEWWVCNWSSRRWHLSLWWYSLFLLIPVMVDHQRTSARWQYKSEYLEMNGGGLHGHI